MDLETLVRKAVEEELEQAGKHVVQRILEAVKMMNRSRPSLDHHVETSQGIGYQLVFAGKLPPTVFTDSKIEAEMGGPIKIELVDTISKAIVKSGPLSSMKIKIVVLDGDLGFDDQESWTEQQFNAKIVSGKKDKKPLVIGDLVIALKDGVGTLNNLSFTDNSSWIKCGNFRLSAKVETIISGQGRIKEAISNAFKVKEYCSKKHEKHYPPSLDDDVWRLKKIARGGLYHKRLTDHHINKVKDFVQMYKNNPNKLKDEVLRCADGLWDTIIEHASTCVYDEKPNAVDGHNYQPPAKRSCIQEPLVESQNDRAYDLPGLKAEPISSPTTGMHMGAHHASTSSSYKGGLEDHNHQLQLPVEKYNLPTQPFSGMHMGAHHASTSSSYKGGLEDHNHQLQLPVENYNLPTQPFSGMHMGAHHASTSSSYKGGLEDHYHQLQLPVEKYNHPIQPSDPTCGDYNIGMEGLQATCNEETIANLDYDMTSQDPMSTSPPVGIQSSDPIRGDYNIRMDRLLATEETVPSSACGMTSQAPTSTSPSFTGLGEHSNGSHLPPSNNDSDAYVIDSFIQCPFGTKFEGNIFDDLIRSPGNE